MQSGICHLKVRTYIAELLTEPNDFIISHLVPGSEEYSVSFFLDSISYLLPLEGKFKVLIPPEYLPMVAEGLQTIMAGGQHDSTLEVRCKDGTLIPVESHEAQFTYKGQPHVLAVSRDITERVKAQQLLEQRVEERTRELTSLLEISHTVASTLHLKPLVGLILDQLKTVVDYTSAAILKVEGDDLVLLDNRSPTSEEQLRQIQFLPQRMGPIWETIASRQSILCCD